MSYSKYECDKCGASSFVDNAIPCPKCEFCGNPIQKNCSNIPSTPHNKYQSKRELDKKRKAKTASLLCFFLGIFGIHKFYEGKIMMGLLYFLTAGLCLIGYIADIVYYINNAHN